MTGLLCTDIYICKIIGQEEWIPNTKPSGSNKKKKKKKKNSKICYVFLLSKFTPLLSPIICRHLFFFFILYCHCFSFSFHTPSVPDLLSSHSLHFTYIPIIDDLLISLHLNFSFSCYSKAFLLYIFIFCYTFCLFICLLDFYLTLYHLFCYSLIFLFSESISFRLLLSCFSSNSYSHLA